MLLCYYGIYILFVITVLDRKKNDLLLNHDRYARYIMSSELHLEILL